MAAPKGNTNARRGTMVRDALRKAAIQDKGSLERIAKKVLAMAEEGDMQAIREVGDRLDGKALQSIETSKADPFEDMSFEELLEEAARLERQSKSNRIHKSAESNPISH